MNKKLKLHELGRLTPEEFKSVPKKPVEIVLDQVRSGHNVGSVFRTADALCIRKVHICGITPQPPNREIQKTALGATETVEWNYWSSTLECVESLKDRGLKVVSVEQTEDSVLLDDFDPEQKEVALIFGNEVRGVEQEVINASDESLEIPQFGTKHSLNISVCAGIVMWDVVRKIR